MKVGIGSNIKYLREVMGLSQKGFGDAIGSPQCTISQWESGYRTPKFPWLLKLKRLAEEYKVDLFKDT